MSRVRRWSRAAPWRWRLAGLGFVVIAVALAGVVLGRDAGPPSVSVPSRFIACPSPPVRYVEGPDGEPRPAKRQPPKGTFDARRLLRLRYAAAERLAGRHGCSVREVEGPHNYDVADDFRPDRIDLALNDDEYVIRVVDIG